MPDPIEPEKTGEAPNRAAVYVRMARENLPNSLDAQIDLIREYAANRKFEIVIKNSCDREFRQSP